MEKVLRIGDRMRFSVELVDSLKHRESDRSLLVEVVDIQDGDDPGVKFLVLKNADVQEAG